MVMIYFYKCIHTVVELSGFTQKLCKYKSCVCLLYISVKSRIEKFYAVCQSVLNIEKKVLGSYFLTLTNEFAKKDQVGILRYNYRLEDGNNL